MSDSIPPPSSPSTSIHPTAIIHPSAQLGYGVRVGPYAIVEENVSLGDGTVLHGHAQVLAGTRIGQGCVIGHASIIGGEPQAKGFDASIHSWVEMGDRNVIREHVTIHRSMYAGQCTRMGHGNFLMAGSHLGHDVVMEDDCVLANAVLIAGHVSVGSRCFLGGSSAFHQFVRIGESCIVQGHASLSTDAPPFCVMSGLNRVFGLNNVGLKRQGYDAATRLELKRAFDALFRSGKNLTQAVAAAQQKVWHGPADILVKFVATRGKKGIATLGRSISSEA